MSKKRTERWPSRIVCLVMVWLGTAGWAWAAVGPTIGLNFAGSSLNDSGFIPPDTDGAIGPNHYAEFLNGVYKIYSKSTGAVLTSSTDTAFWQAAGVTPTGGGVSDPRVIYDPAIQRWIASTIDLAASNNFLLAVSNNSDPTQGWKAVLIAADPNGLLFADFPTLGVNGDGVFISANMFNTSNAFVSVTTLSLPKTSLLAGNTSGFKLLTNVGGASGASIQPVVNLNDRPMPESLIWIDDATGDAMRLDLQGPISNPSLSSTVATIAIGPLSPPPAAPQKGTRTLIDTGDGRISAIVVRQLGELPATHTYGGIIWTALNINVSGRAAVQWFKINEADNTVLQSGVISNTVSSFYYPSLGVNPNGDVVMGFTVSSPSTYPSSYAVTGSTVNGLTSFNAPVQLRAGLSHYVLKDTSGRDRWGDYSATNVDPTAPNQLWTIQEWCPATNIWQTQITQVIFPQPIAFNVALSHSYTYQNAPVSTGNGHLITLTLSIAADAFGNSAYTATVAANPSSTGKVIIQPTANPLVWNLVGGQRGSDPVGPVTLDIFVQGATAGQGGTSVQIAVRLLGDINGTGAVTTADLGELNLALDNLPTPGFSDYDFDLTADGDVTTADRVLLYKILDGVTVP